MEFLVITGMSGAGKTTASSVLEDLGCYCIDNLPSSLIPVFVKTYTTLPSRRDSVAFVSDVRSESDFEALLAEIERLKAEGHTCRTIFLDCEDRVLINRYKETRHLHPLVTLKNLSVSEALALERQMLSSIRAVADYCIDTTSLTPAQLRDKLGGIRGAGQNGGLMVTCLSFGYKYGVAADADLIFDVRCFPNPFYQPTLKSLTGLDNEVKAYVFGHEKTRVFLQKLYDMVDFLLPLYAEEGKTQLTVAIGCTGGKHRSVAIAEALASHIREASYHAVTVHRDIIKKFIGDK